MKFDIVVAHYKENLDWIREIDRNLVENIFVYTKGDKADPIPGVRQFYLTNVGRESHTYIWHVVNNWDSISSGTCSDFVFFVQGGPHDMSPKKIMEWAEIVSEDGLDHTYNFRIGNPNDFLTNGRISQWAGQTKPADCGVVDWCVKHVKSNPKDSFPIFWNGCFGVSTRLIAQSELSRYVKIMQNELSDINPECGHYCERLWYYMFNMEKANSKVPSNSYAFFGGHDGRRHHGCLKLRDDGTLGMYSHFNETFWSKDDNSITLHNVDRNPTSILNKVSNDEYFGSFSGDQNVKHRLKFLSEGFLSDFA
jgi:hypothetical protein